MDIAASEREKLERPCRDESRPPVAEDRRALTPSGHVRFQLKTPYRDGMTQIVPEPLDFIARLAALVPPPRMHLTPYRGMFASHSQLRAVVTPARRGVVAAKHAPADPSQPPAPARESAAAQCDWVIVSMQDDWRRVYDAGQN